MVDIMRSITGKVHTYQSIHPVDRAITHIDRLVCRTQPFELIQDVDSAFLVDHRLQVVYLAVAKLVEKSWAQYLIKHEYTVTESIISKPAG